MADVYFLKLKCTMVIINKNTFEITNNNFKDLGNAVFALTKCNPNTSIAHNKRVSTDDYNYFTKNLINTNFANNVGIVNTHYLHSDFGLLDRTERLKRFLPGFKLLTVDLQVLEGTSTYVYAIKLEDEKTGNFCLISTSPGPLATRFYYKSTFAFMESQQLFIDVPGFLTVDDNPNIYTGQCIFVNNFNDDGTISDLYGFIGARSYQDRPGTERIYTVKNNLQFSTKVIEWLNSLNKYEFIPTDPTDPYNKGGSSNSSGGGGTFGGGNTIFGGASDSIDIPPLPTASASSAGFITLFNPSLAQLNNLANYMWSDLFSLETFKKIFADPMDCILGLSIVPVKPASAGTSTVKIGNVSTDVSMNKTSSQYVAVDCGTIDVKEYWGAYLDYAPYTQCEIYLPYVGTKQISVDDVMSKAVHVVYHVDILSGACNAYVKCGDSVLYTFVGQCSSSIPISGNDWTNVLNGAISVAGKIGLAMATGGATALMSGIGAASSIISSSKPTVERSGAMSSTGGLLGIQKPYLILTRPKQALPENQNKYTGYPSFITMALSECTGYTEIDSVHLENMTCTDEEAQEIENLLKSGVIF